jgi:Cu/Zn superoxide dismutase
MPGMRIPFAFAAIALMLSVALAGCETAATINAKIFSRGPGLGGRIHALGGSAAKGFIVVSRREGGATLIVNLNDVGPGTYRVVFHMNGNCSSRNGFSAGPPWAPPGGEVRTYEGAMGVDGLLNMSIPISGLLIDPPDGILGRSVVVHDTTSSSLDAEPDVRNNRIACVVLNEAAEIVL